MKSSVAIALLLFTLYPATGQLSSGAQEPPLAASNTTVAVSSAAEGRTNNAASTAVVSFVLKPTAIAPSGSSGTAQITTGVLALHLSQLGPGKYTLQAVRRSNGAVEPLGAITIVDPTLSPSRQASDNKKEASANPEAVLVQTDASVSLPKGLLPQEIERVRVLGTGENAVLDSSLK